MRWLGSRTHTQGRAVMRCGPQHSIGGADSKAMRRSDSVRVSCLPILRRSPPSTGPDGCQRRFYVFSLNPCCCFSSSEDDTFQPPDHLSSLTVLFFNVLGSSRRAARHRLGSPIELMATSRGRVFIFFIPYLHVTLEG